MSGWTQAEAVALAKKIEAVCPAFGCHVALTGGLLYKDDGEYERADPDDIPIFIDAVPSL